MKLTLKAAKARLGIPAKVMIHSRTDRRDVEATAKKLLIKARRAGDMEAATQISEAESVIKEFVGTGFYCACGERKNRGARQCRMCYYTTRYQGNRLVA